MADSHRAARRIAFLVVRFCLVLFPVLATGLWSADPAAAHFSLAEADPADGSRAEGPVTEIRLRYTKAGTPLGSGFTLRDAARTVLPVSRESPDGGRTWLIRPATALPDGQFGLVWKVASADGHPMSGVVEFTVVGAPAPAAPSASATSRPVPEGGEPRASGPQRGPDGADEETDPPGQLLGAAGRWLGYGGALLGVGGIAFALTTLVGTRGDLRTVQHWVRGAGLAVVAGAGIESLALAAAFSGGETLTAAFQISALGALATAPAGAAVALRVLGAVGLIVAGTLEAAPFHRRHAAPGRGRHAGGDFTSVVDQRVRTIGRLLLPERPATVAAGVPMAGLTPDDLAEPDGVRVRLRARFARPVLLAVAVALLLGAHLFDGHTASTGPRPLVLLADLAHTTAAAVWVGGVILLAVLLLTRARRGEPTGATEMAARFAVPATGAVAFAGGAGAVLAFLILDRPADLVDSTWGRVLLVKIVLVGVVALVGLYNSRRVIPRLDERGGEATRTLRRTVAVEAVVMLAVVVATAILVGSATT